MGLIVTAAQLSAISSGTSACITAEEDHSGHSHSHGGNDHGHSHGGGKPIIVYKGADNKIRATLNKVISIMIAFA